MSDIDATAFQRALETEKLEALAEFAAGAGHEINNPLTVISGRAQLLLREETDPERRRALALISAQAMRVHEMIADMMLFARPPRPEPKPVDLLKLIDEMIAELGPPCERQETAIRRIAKKGTGTFCRNGPKGASHKRCPSPFSPVVDADPVQLGVALRAICRNAMEALQRGGYIEVEVQESGVGDQGSGIGKDKSRIPESPDPRIPESPNEVLIHVRDDGPGISPEERRHLFDPFYSARQAGRGLGLGLSKAWRIVANHGGRIDVQSQPGRGATFTVRLPLTRKAAGRS